MKKIAILLTLAMVFGLGVSAMAADLKFSGKAWLNWEKMESEDDGAFTNGYRFQLDGKLDENSGFQIRYEGDPAALKRANYWVNFPGVGKLVAGKQNINYSALDQLSSNPHDVLDGTNFLNNTFTGISFAPALPEGFKAVGFVNVGVSAVAATPAIEAQDDKILRVWATSHVHVDADSDLVNVHRNQYGSIISADVATDVDAHVCTDVCADIVYVEHGSELDCNEVLLEAGNDAVAARPYVSAADQYTWGLEASYDFSAAKIYGGYTKQKLNAENEEQEGKWVIGASVPIIPETLTLYGEYACDGEEDENDEKVVGGKLSAGGFDFIAEYAIDSEVYMVEAYKTIRNVELNLAYFGNLGADKEDSKVALATTLYF